MFTAKLIAITFIGSFVIVWPMSFLQDKEKWEFLKICVAIFTIFSVYNLIAGIYLLTGWEDPLSQASGQQQGRVAARRGGGFVVLVSFLSLLVQITSKFIVQIFCELSTIAVVTAFDTRAIGA